MAIEIGKAYKTTKTSDTLSATKISAEDYRRLKEEEKAASIPSPSKVAQTIRDNPSIIADRHKENVELMSTIPSRYYNKDVADAVKEINRPSVYEYNQNSLNPFEKLVVDSAAKKVGNNKLLDLTKEEKTTLTNIAKGMEEKYGATALYEYTGRENIDMFDALWWLTGAYQRTKEKDTTVYEDNKLKRANRKKLEYAVLSSKDFKENVNAGEQSLIRNKSAESKDNNFIERFVSDYLTDNEGGSKKEKRDNAFAKKVASGEDIYRFMTADEKKIFLYFLGKEKPKEAFDYVENLKGELESRKAKSEAEGNEFVGNVVDAAKTGLHTGLINIGRSATATKAVTGQNLSELDIATLDTTYQEKLWSEISAKSNDRTAVGNILLKFVNSISSQAPAIVVGSLTGGTGYFTAMSMGTVGAQTTEAINSGYSAQRGFLHGLVSSALEIATDKLLGGVGSMMSGGKSKSLVKTAVAAIDSIPVNTALRNWLAKQTVRTGAMLAEGAEEFIQELLEPIIRNVIYAEDNKYSLETFKNALESFVVGALSGGALATPSLNSTLSNTQFEIIGDGLKETVGIEGVLDLARFTGNDSALFMEIEQKYKEGKEIDSAELGRLHHESSKEFANPNSKTAQEFAEQKTDAAIVEAKKKQASEQTEINSDLQPTAETVAEDSETTLDKASELLEDIEDSNGLTEKQTDKISLEPKNLNKNHLDAATQKVYKDVTNKLGTEVIYEDVAAVLKKEGYQIDENNPPDGYIDSDGRIHLSYYSTNPTNFVFKHELTHYGERYNKEGYKSYTSAIDKTKIFKNWLQEKTGSKSESIGELKGLYRDGVTKSRGKLAPQSIAKLNSEMYADFSGEVVFNEQRFDKFVNEINAKDRPKVIQFIIDFFKKIRDILPKTLKGEIKSLESKYVEMLREAKNNPTEQNGGREFSFAGQKARTANYSKLDEAIKMEEIGKATPEEIRQQTGWFRGYDGKWRFEISDRDMDFNINGHFTNPDVIRHRELEYKFITDTENITEAEINELKALSKTLEGVRKRPTKLGDYLKHNKLFEAYPELKDFKLSFEKFEDGSIGEYRSNKKEIVLDNSLKDDISRLRKTLVHEIQHAIQDIEGFEGGSNVEYWKEQRQEIVETLAGARANLNLWLDDIGYQEFAKKSMRQVVDKKKTLEQHWEDCKKFKENSKYAKQIANSEAEIAEFERQYQEITNGMTPYEQYQNTAGEIEARDSANRWWRTDEARKEKRPDIDRTDVVFADKIPSNYSDNGKKGKDFSVPITPQEDAEYMQAVENDDTETAQRMVDEAARKNGYRIKGHHGTDVRFTIFDREKTSTSNDFGQGFYFSSSEFEAEQYQKDNAFGDTYNKIDGIAYDNALERIRDMGEDADDDALFTQIYNEEFDKELKRRTDEGAVINAYLKMENPFIVSPSKWITEEEAIEIAKNTMYVDNVPDDIAISDWIHSIKAYAKQNNGKVDTHHFANNMGHSINLTDALLHQGKYDGILDYSIRTKFGSTSDYHAIALYSNKIKDSSPVTYDDKGNVIPLSKRFNSEDTDIRFSVPATTDQSTKNESQSDTDNADDMSGVDIRGMANIIEDLYNNGKISDRKRNELLNKLYGEADERYGTIKQGENPQNDVVVPKKVADDAPTRRFTRTELESGKFSDRLMAEVGAEILKGNRTYEPISDKEAQNFADKAFMEGRAQKIWDDFTRTDSGLNKYVIAVGERLLTEALEKNDTAAVLKMDAELSEVLTRAGQTIQASRMFKKMTPLGRVSTVQRRIDVLNKELQQKYKGFNGIKVNLLLLEQLSTAVKEEDVNAVMEDITKDAASQVPANWLDKFNAWRYFAMLSNPRTHIRNLVGNVVFSGAVAMKYGIAATAEDLLIKDASKRSKTLKIEKKYKDFAENDFKTKEAQNLLKGMGYLDSKGEIMDSRRIFKNDFVESMTKSVGDLLEGSDMLFKKMHYRFALAGFLASRKVDLKNIDAKTLDKARYYAANEAKKATFQDVSFLANSITNFLKINKYSEFADDKRAKAVSAAGTMLKEGVLPFKRTPINIIKRGIEYGPLGLISGAVELFADVKKGNATVYEAIDKMAAGLSGSLIMLLGLCLTGLGAINGGFDDDEEEDKFKKLNGEQEYSLKIGNKSYSIDWAAPAALPFFIGVELMKEMAKDQEVTFADVGDIIANTLEPMLNLSMLSGVQNVFESIRYDKENKTLSGIAINAATSLLMQLVPSPLGGIARTIDPTQRTWYTNKDSKLLPPKAQSVVNNVKTKIPGLSYTMPASIDAWGRERKRGGLGERLLENFASPGYYSEETYSKTDNELLRIYRATNESKVFPDTASKSIEVKEKTKHLTAKEWERYAKQIGQDSFEFVTRFMESEAYEELNDKQRAKVIERLYEFALDKARSELDYSYEYVSRMEGEDKNGEPILTEKEYNGMTEKAKRHIIQENFLSKTEIKYFDNIDSLIRYYANQAKAN